MGALARKLAPLSYYRWRAAEVRREVSPAVKSSGVHLASRRVRTSTLKV
jgi:hypothetical protein